MTVKISTMLSAKNIKKPSYDDRKKKTMKTKRLKMATVKYKTDQGQKVFGGLNSDIFKSCFFFYFYFEAL